MKLSSLFFATFLFLVTLSACDSGGNLEQPTEITIGLAAPLTGVVSRTGQGMRLAAEMAIDEVNASRVEGTPSFRLLVANTNSTTDGAEEALRSLINDGVVFVVGPATSSNTDHIIPIIDERRIVTISPNSAAVGLSAKSEWLFRSSLSIQKLLAAGIPATRDFFGYSNVGTLTNEGDAFSRSARDIFVTQVDSLRDVSIGTTLTFNRPGNDPQPDFSSDIQKFSNALPDLEAIFLFGLGPDRDNFILKSHELGLRSVPIIVPLLSSASIRTIRESNLDAAEGVISIHVWISGSTHPASRTFVSAFQTRYREIPNDIHARSYAATKLLLQSIRDAGSGGYTNVSVRDQLASLKNVDTIYGSFSFDSNGDAQYAPQVAIARGADFEPFDSTN